MMMIWSALTALIVGCLLYDANGQNIDLTCSSQWNVTNQAFTNTIQWTLHSAIIINVVIEFQIRFDQYEGEGYDHLSASSFNVPKQANTYSYSRTESVVPYTYNDLSVEGADVIYASYTIQASFTEETSAVHGFCLFPMSPTRPSMLTHVKVTSFNVEAHGPLLNKLFVDLHLINVQWTLPTQPVVTNVSRLLYEIWVGLGSSGHVFNLTSITAVNETTYSGKLMDAEEDLIVASHIETIYTRLRCYYEVTLNDVVHKIYSNWSSSEPISITSDTTTTASSSTIGQQSTSTTSTTSSGQLSTSTTSSIIGDVTTGGTSSSVISTDGASSVPSSITMETMETVSMAVTTTVPSLADASSSISSSNMIILSSSTSTTPPLSLSTTTPSTAPRPLSSTQSDSISSPESHYPSTSSSTSSSSSIVSSFVSAVISGADSKIQGNSGLIIPVVSIVIPVVSLLLLLILIIAIVVCVRRRRRFQLLSLQLESEVSFHDDEVSFVRGGKNQSTITSLSRQNLLETTCSIDSCDEWELPVKSVIIHDKLGGGCFGEVFKGEVKGHRNVHLVSYESRQNNARFVAVKILKNNASNQEKNEFLEEIELMKIIAQSHNPHVVNMLGAVTRQEPMCVVTEYLEYGDLLGYLKKYRTNMYDSKEEDTSGYVVQMQAECVDLISFAYQIASGMEYLSSLKIIHRDLACRNVLVGEGKLLKVSDFGLSRNMTYDSAYVKTSSGPLPIRWMAIESIMYHEFTTASDVWSFGITLWEIGTLGAVPYANIDNSDILRTLQNGNRIDKPPAVTDEVYDIMLTCFKDNPSNRPTFSELRKNFDSMLSKDKHTKDLYLDLSLPPASTEPRITLSKSSASFNRPASNMYVDDISLHSPKHNQADNTSVATSPVYNNDTLSTSSTLQLPNNNGSPTYNNDTLQLPGIDKESYYNNVTLGVPGQNQRNNELPGYI